MISVCIATYNGEKYIREQLLSILPQLGVEDEIVISDDESTDNTLTIINDLHDPRIRVLQHSPYNKPAFPQDKPTHNFVNALQASRGEYIFLADQDDVWLPNKVSTMLQALETADLAIHDCQVRSFDLQQITHPSYFQYIRVHTGAFKNAVRCTYLGCCMAFRRSLLLKAMPFPTKGAAHDQWIGIVAALYGQPCLVNQSLILYRRHTDTQTHCGEKSKFHLLFQLRYKLIILFYTILKLISKK